MVVHVAVGNDILNMAVIAQQNAQRRALPGVTPGRSGLEVLAAEPSRIRM